MILNRVEAENILKYRSLRLTDLPAHGHIAVVGTNEAGKTAIGETICLGLFGRTFSLRPNEIGRVVRWGEYSGTVTVSFVVGDGEEFSITREIDNTGRHRARLERPGEEVPLAEGVDAVDKAIREIAGFTFQSFIDSFYLAQREMEVPHAKSATVKALIGVDKLEAVARELEAEVAETANVLEKLEADLEADHRRIAALNIDRARLGRLEAEREAKAAAASTAEAKAEELSTRAASIGKAAAAFAKAARKFVETTTRATRAQWRERERSVAAGLVEATKVSAASGIETYSLGLAKTHAALKSIGRGLAEYDQIRNLAKLYRGRLAFLLDDSPSGTAADDATVAAERNIEACYDHRRDGVRCELARTAGRRRKTLVFGLVSMELALLTWTGWAIPDSVVGNLLRTLIAVGSQGQSLVLLVVAIGATTLTALCAAIYVRTTKELGRLQDGLSAINDEAQTARGEMEVIDAVDAVPLPDALQALRCVRNDLLRSAIVSFSHGEGAVLVEPEAASSKLAEIRGGSATATSMMQKAQARFADRAETLRREAGETREAVHELSRQVADEREQWKRLEVLERRVAELAAKTNAARHRIVVRTVGRELIEGACRQIYARFHPELRRLVSRILPRLTEDRYEHLEIDDDLRVRVFCKERNDFVGLAEISNGTHRQLMLCVRLALSQALIASSSKSAQFIFLDEPFVFFDERRAGNAIDVLRKISPEITQVFLAAQRFKNPAAFDMCLKCDVGHDAMEVSGKSRRGMREAS